MKLYYTNQCVKKTFTCRKTFDDLVQGEDREYMIVTYNLLELRFG